jgi:hypothetical protein
MHVRWNRLHHPEERATLARWARVLTAIGLWDSPEGGQQFLRHAGVPRLAHHLVERGLSSFQAVPLAAARGLLFRIPCPLRRNWSRHIHTLGDKLLLSLVDRHYFAMNPNLPEFIPALFCSLAITVTPALAVDTFEAFRGGDRHRLLGRALSWLARELPQLTLPDTVERELASFAWARLERNPPR